MQNARVAAPAMLHLGVPGWDSALLLLQVIANAAAGSRGPDAQGHQIVTRFPTSPYYFLLINLMSRREHSHNLQAKTARYVAEYNS